MAKKQRSSSENGVEHFEPVFRHASNGSWLIVLVPCSLLCGMENTDKISSTYLTIAIISVGLLFSSLWIVSKGMKRMSRFKLLHILANCVLSSLITSALLITIQNYDFLYSSCAAILSVASYLYVLTTIIYSCPKSFTFGEASVVSQSLILYLTSFILNTLSSLSEPPNSCNQIATYILQTGFFTIFTILTLAYHFRELMRQFKIFITALCSLFLAFAVFLPYVVMRRNSILWIFELMSDPISIRLIMFWILCCVFCIYFLWRQAVTNRPASSANRKNFHFAILFVLMPGLVLSPCLMYLASGVGFAIMILIEIIRQLQIGEFSKKLQSCFDVFKDEKDEGSFALTPLYLMLGCVAPFWIYPISFERSIPLPVLSGILSIAVGDTAASICGTSFGKHRWPGTEKTLEGTTGCIASQMLALFFFAVTGIVQTLDTHTIYKSFIVIVTTSVIEAITDQIDNLVLPLVSYILFMLFFY